MRSFRPRLTVVAAAALAAALAGCGSTSTTSTTASTTPTTIQTTPTSTPATTTPGVAACSTAVLAASATFGGAAAGSSYYTVSVKNNGPTPCALDGYPTYRFLGPSGAGGAGAGPEVPISVVDRGPAPTQVSIAPGSTADAIIVYSDVGSNCPTIASALMNPPGSSESLSFPISFSPCNGSVVAYAFGKAGSESP